jgi:hypothetical protein
MSSRCGPLHRPCSPSCKQRLSITLGRIRTRSYTVFHSPSSIPSAGLTCGPHLPLRLCIWDILPHHAARRDARERATRLRGHHLAFCAPARPRAHGHPLCVPESAGVLHAAYSVSRAHFPPALADPADTLALHGAAHLAARAPLREALLGHAPTSGVLPR